MTALSLLDDFRAQLQAAGLQPREVTADGLWRRCPTDSHPKRKNGSYLLMPDGLGLYHDWADGQGVQVWRDGRVRELTPAQKAAIERQTQRMEAERRAKRAKGIEWSRKLWAEGQRCMGHPYLERKGLSAIGTQHLKTWRGTVNMGQGEPPITDTWLLAPLYIGDSLVNVQRISSTGVKRQVAGAPQSGAYLLLNRQRAAMTCICEGVATGLAVFQCATDARVVVAYFADNLQPVVNRLRPTGNVVIAADNDHGTQARGKGNPGIEKARNAAELIDAGVAYPEGIAGTDWADAMAEWKEAGPRRVARLIVQQSRYVPAAGNVPRVCRVTM